MAEDNPELQAALRQLDKEFEVCEWHCGKAQRRRKNTMLSPAMKPDVWLTCVRP